jgi:hypothetical protein
MSQHETKSSEQAFSSMSVDPRMPVSNKRRPGQPVPQDLIGASIIRIGTIPPDGPEVEGGGLVIDFMKYMDKEMRRIVFEFNENAMWVVYEGTPK